MFEEWHTSKELQTDVRDFHGACARQPSGKDIKKANEIIKKMEPVISGQMKAQGLFENARYEYRGSSYEGVKVAKSALDQDLEFDIMYVIKGGTDLQAHNSETNGYADLKVKADKVPKPVFQKTMAGNCVSAFRTRNKFYSHLSQCDFSALDLTELGYKKDEIAFKMSYNGPAVKIVVMKSGEKFFSIDLAPHYDVTGQGTMYVPKAPKEHTDCSRWFRSFSLDEKKKFDGMDKDNGCRKMVLRCLKVFVKSRAELSCLTSQHLKTVLFKAVDSKPSWKQEELGERFMDVLKILEDSLEKRVLPRYFQREVNLFENLKDATMQNMKCRCCRLRRNSQVIPKLLSQAVSQTQTTIT